MKSTGTAASLKLADLRNEYSGQPLDESRVDRDPVAQFQAWMSEAIAAQAAEPTAMTLATVNSRGRPSARIVLLKGVDERGFVFFTNYASRKGREIEANPLAALTFFWKELERQVRIEGSVEKVSAEESAAYYATRPLGARIGAWASPQSERIADRAWLQAKVDEMAKQYGEAPPCPPHWGGYRVHPDYVELWQGRQNRLHDRIAYTRAGAQWTIARLAP